MGPLFAQAGQLLANAAQQFINSGAGKYVIYKTSKTVCEKVGELFK